MQKYCCLCDDHIHCCTRLAFEKRCLFLLVVTVNQKRLFITSRIHESDKISVLQNIAQEITKMSGNKREEDRALD